jgi:hypothetical protein
MVATGSGALSGQKSLQSLKSSNEIANNQQKNLADKEAVHSKQVQNIIPTILIISKATLLTSIAVSYIFTRKMSKQLRLILNGNEFIIRGYTSKRSVLDIGTPLVWPIFPF